MDWLTNPAQSDADKQRLRLMRYAIREEATRLLFWLFVLVSVALLIAGY